MGWHGTRSIRNGGVGDIRRTTTETRSTQAPIVEHHAQIIFCGKPLKKQCGKLVISVKPFRLLSSLLLLVVYI